MRKMNLTMEEMDKYSTIKKLIETDGNKKRAAIALNCSVRHINRMIKRYKKSGKEFFIHGNRGRKPAHALDANTKQLILDLHCTKYPEANITHFSGLLKKHKNITVSASAIHSILMQDFILPTLHTTNESSLETSFI
ncbi:helix-turn-helix domain-containing protein [Clostridium sp. FP1]|uniref:helix-turn-helix domain-containing protein n=1 Tax=Clostridium sp. FP1 TaxID=2724076 RepID=UPI0013E97A2A|nr:helix-turn-helix domain-containing protein [Clostridium sp. FP1]MBZ9636555.1 hypothetical protein [Clostridium sp. FP1]